MKKTIRIAALFLALLMLALPLVGCDRIDEMRANQGFWNDDGSISFNGKTYKLLSPSKYLYTDLYRNLEITEKNVPVLLSERYGKNFSISYDEVFIAHGSEYYCRADKYDYVEKRIKEGAKLDHLGFYYTHNGYKIGKVGHVLTKEEVSAIEDIMRGENIVKESIHEVASYNICIVLDKCSSDMLFATKSDIRLYIDSDNCYFISDGPVVYSVPAKYDRLFDNMFEEFREINSELFRKDNRHPHSDDVN